MNALPPTLLPAPLAGRLRGSRRATPAAGAAMTLLAIGLVGCGNEAPPTPAASVATQPAAASGASAVPSVTSAPSVDVGGLVIAADGSEFALTVLGADALARPLDSPGAPIRFLGAARGGVVVVLADGSIAVGRVADASIQWTPDRRFQPAAAAAVDRTGRRIAVIARRELESTRPLRIWIAALGTGDVRSVVIAGLHANGPPAWISGDRILVRTVTNAGVDVFVLVDPNSGRHETMRLDAIDAFASGDGGTVGIVNETVIRVAAADDLADELPGTAVALGGAAQGLHVATAALDAKGERIAFVLEDDDQRPVAIGVASAGGGWTMARQIAVPAGATLVRVAWSG
jgi:hypothetical protein